MPHPQNCASYPRRSLLLSNTLKSILAQTDEDIRVVVVVNEPPECELPKDPRIELVLVSFPPSSSPLGRPSLTGIEIDKGSKLGIGASAAVRHDARHVMFVDSDDYIHNDIARFVAQDPGAPGWYSDSGYFHMSGRRSVRAIDHGFHQRNGSTHVIRTDLLGVPGDLSRDLSRDDVLDRIGREKATAIMGRHRPIVEYFDRLGTPFSPLPFPAVIWEIGTGENCTGVFAGAGRKESVAGRISKEFGLAVPSRGTALKSAAVTSWSRSVRLVTRKSS